MSSIARDKTIKNSYSNISLVEIETISTDTNENQTVTEVQKSMFRFESITKEFITGNTV